MQRHRARRRPYLALDADPPRSYVATEFVPGPTLGDHIAAGGALPESQALAIASQICAAVDHVHDRQFLHYDLKPTQRDVVPGRLDPAHRLRPGARRRQ